MREPRLNQLVRINRPGSRDHGTEGRVIRILPGEPVIVYVCARGRIRPVFVDELEEVGT